VLSLTVVVCCTPPHSMVGSGARLVCGPGSVRGETRCCRTNATRSAAVNSDITGSKVSKELAVSLFRVGVVHEIFGFGKG
jgi:hypothetical protein